MVDDKRGRIGLDSFWESADRDGSEEHPLERELAERMDAVARYRSLIADCEEMGRDEDVKVLTEQHERERLEAQRLREALAREKGRGEG